MRNFTKEKLPNPCGSGSFLEQDTGVDLLFLLFRKKTIVWHPSSRVPADVHRTSASDRFDSLPYLLQQKSTHFGCLLLEQDTGVEPAFTAWEAVVLPIYESCIGKGIIAKGFGNINLFLSKGFCFYVHSIDGYRFLCYTVFNMYGRGIFMTWNLDEALIYYKTLGAPADQTALISLLREIQQELGGSIPASAVSAIAQAYQIKEALVLALIRRIPSLRLSDRHCLELCAGPNCGKSAALAACAEKLQKQYGFTLKYVPCMRLCGKGPNIRWDGTLHHQVTEDLLSRLIAQSF